MPKKYFLLALGEITLLVAVILIALQLNIASEDKKQDRQFKANLTRLHASISNELLNLQSSQTSNDYKLDICSTMMATTDLHEELIPNFVLGLSS